MNLLESIQSAWQKIPPFELGQLTFIEEIGRAAAENVRSAAIARYFNSNNYKAREFLKHYGISLPDIRLFVDREVHFSMNVHDEKNKKRSFRLDLGFFDSADVKKPLAFFEMKWLADLRIEQIDAYRNAINEEHPNLDVPIIALCPVKPVFGILDDRVDNVVLDDFTALASNITPDTESKNNIEIDMAYTLQRWIQFQQIVKQAVRNTYTQVSEFTKLHDWLEGKSSSFNNYSKAGYGNLLKRIIVAELADMTSKVENMLHFKRCHTSEGNHGDLQADVADVNKSSFFPHKAQISGHGILTNIRYRIPPGSLEEIQVSLGTSIEPYKGSQLDRQKENEHCRIIRNQICEVLKEQNLETLSSNCKYRWKCLHTNIFKGKSTVAEILEHGKKLRSVLKDVAEVISE